MILGENGETPQIKYPCDWNFTVIGKDPHEMETSVRKIADKYNYSLEVSNVSRRGKYFSFKLTVEVPSEEIRLEIYNSLEKSDCIKIVL